MNIAVARAAAPSLSMRNASTLMAMLPALLVLCVRDPALGLRLGLTALAALALEALALRLRRQPLAPFLREGSWLTIALLLAACLNSRPAWQLPCALFVALVLARQAFGGLGRNLFHPVAAGAAFIVAIESRAGPAVVPDPALAIAWLLGGLALLRAGIVRWEAPTSLLVAAACGILASGQDWHALTEAYWTLAAFFIAGDPVTTPESARGRAFAGGAVGLVSALAGIAVLPFALLAMNAATPMIDAWLPARRTRPVGA